MSKRKRTDETLVTKRSDGGFDIDFSEDDGREVAKRLNEGQTLTEALFFGDDMPVEENPTVVEEFPTRNEMLYKKTLEAIISFIEGDDPIWTFDDIQDACEYALKGSNDFLDKWDVE